MDADADIQTVIKKEDFDTNPWSVDDASVFLKYCCPECNYNDGSLKVFSHHALENHVRSSILFKDMKNGDETIPTNKIEQDHKSYFDTSPPSPDHYADQGNLLRGIVNWCGSNSGKKNLQSFGQQVLVASFLYFKLKLKMFFYKQCRPFMVSFQRMFF